MKNEAALAQAEEHCRVEIPLQTRLAPVSAVHVDARTVDVTWTTGATVKRAAFGIDGIEFYNETLRVTPEAVDLTRLNAGAPVLDSHGAMTTRDQIGVVERASVSDGKGHATIRFPKAGIDASADRMFALVQDKIVRNISVGYQPLEARLERASAAGQLDNLIVERWMPKELSFVSVPADAGAQVRAAERKLFPLEITLIAAPDTGTRAAPNDPGSTAYDARKDTHMSKSETAGAEAPDKAKVKEETVVTTTTETEKQKGAELKEGETRSAPFTATEALEFYDHARGFGVEEEARDLVKRNIPASDARAAILKAAGDKQRAEPKVFSSHSAGVVTGDGNDVWKRQAENALLDRLGLTNLVAQAAKVRGETVDLNPGSLRGIRNVELARMSLERSGAKVNTYDRDAIVGMALTQTRSSNGMQTTSDFGVVLETALHKTLQAAFAVAPDTWTAFCGQGTVVDFRPHPRYILGSLAGLDTVTEAGEIKNKPIPDGSKENISATTKGNIISLSRQAIVNDDMGVFTNNAVMLGRASKLQIEKDVYALLALNGGLGPTMNDGLTLFHASHNNIAATPAAPGVAPFDIMRTMLASQTDLSGNEFLDIGLAIWLGPIGLTGAANVTNGSQYDPDATSKLQRPNIVQGLFSRIVGTPRLSGTRWYGFANPDFNPAIEVVFLNNVKEPRLDTMAGWRTDGTEWRVLFDYGVGALNWRSAATNAGA